MEASMLDVAGLHHEYTQGTVAIDDIGFGVRQGEVVSIVGPSGCGKTTLLRCISGLQEPTRGDVRLLGVPVDGVPDDLAMVFQDYSRSLFPWLKVGANVAFPLQYRKIDAAERDRRVDESLRRSGCPTRAASSPGSCRAACSSAWPSRGRWPTGPSSCSWTSRSRPWTPRPGRTSRTSSSTCAGATT
jgi:NitT/TauT family transport system ATP-binding protein